MVNFHHLKPIFHLFPCFTSNLFHIFLTNKNRKLYHWETALQVPEKKNHWNYHGSLGSPRDPQGIPSLAQRSTLEMLRSQRRLKLATAVCMETLLMAPQDDPIPSQANCWTHGKQLWPFREMLSQKYIYIYVYTIYNLYLQSIIYLYIYIHIDVYMYIYIYTPPSLSINILLSRFLAPFPMARRLRGHERPIAPCVPWPHWSPDPKNP